MINLLLALIVLYSIFCFVLLRDRKVNKKQRRRRVYIAHPYGGNPENMKEIAKICRKAAVDGFLPISPVHAFSFLDEAVKDERELALGMCKELLLAADEIWLCGNWQNSEGCRIELKAAQENGLPILMLREGRK